MKHTHIISSSIGLYNASPGDGAGFLADVVSQARAAGILWITAAGNDRASHWGGAYHNTDDDNFHEFANGDDVNCFTFTLAGGSDCAPFFFGTVNIFVRWSDWAQVDQDFDVHLVRWNGTSWETVASSTNVQNGSPGQTPTEWISANIFDFAPYGFRIGGLAAAKRLISRYLPRASFRMALACTKACLPAASPIWPTRGMRSR